MSPQKPTILVCDDEESVRAAIRLVLERDYDLTFASDGEEAVQQFARQPADLVLLDIKLPKKDGLEVLKELMTKQPSPRVLMLTAYQSVELAQRATHDGAVDYVPKPFTRDQLRQAVERALRLPAWQRPAPTA
jgi:CheY-like chemotaxis protein